MIEIVPYLLVIVGWTPGAPADSMALRHSLHRSPEACEAQGAALIAQRDGAQSRAEATRYRYFCIPAPTPQEYRGLFEPDA